MKITFIRATYNRTQYDTAELFSIDSSVDSINFYGRNGTLEREKLPDGVDTKAVLATILNAFDAEKENVYIFSNPESGVKIFTDEEFSIDVKEKEALL